LRGVDGELVGIFRIELALSQTKIAGTTVSDCRQS
jgi:hypothetical protein